MSTYVLQLLSVRFGCCFLVSRNGLISPLSLDESMVDTEWKELLRRNIYAWAFTYFRLRRVGGLFSEGSNKINTPQLRCSPVYKGIVYLSVRNC